MQELDTSVESGEQLHRPHDQSERPNTKRTALPKFQLFIVFLIQFAEPVTATVIYPFVNQFVRETGVTGGDERETGYFAGIIESAFFVAEALTVFHWGWASDRYGRRPVLLLGPLGLSLAMLSFGLSNTFWILVASRCLQGAFNGNIGVSKSIMAEITDSSNIADAYALMPLMWSCGVTIGPILGGMLSHPAIHWPDTFGRSFFFHKHPYFLPCAAAALIALISCLIASIGLRETLPSAIARQKGKKKQVADGQGATISSDSGLLTHENGSGINYGSTLSVYGDATTTPQNDQAEASSAPSPFRALLVPRVIILMTSYAFIAFIDMSSQVLRPLVYSTSVTLGGLGFDPYRIGMIMGIWGFINAFVQALILGPVIKRFGARKVQIVTQINYVVIMALYPLLTLLARRAGRVDINVWAVMVVQLIFQMSGGIAYVSAQILFIESAGRASMGATNGLAQAVASSMRSIAPSFASSLFSVSLQKKLAGGNMVFFVLLGIALVGVRVSLSIPKSMGLPHR